MITLPVFAEADGIRHGFFTRRGGVSNGAFASLNCGFGSGDDPDKVARNRAAAMALLDLPGRCLVTCRQVHSAETVTVTAPWPRDAAPAADGMVTATPGIALGVLAADCAPVLFADAQAGVIGAAHGGWRGALTGVMEATVARMVEHGARPERIGAGIGPCIAGQSYEVGPEFPGRFAEIDRDSGGFFVAAERAGHFRFDLPGYIAARLARLGLGRVVQSGCDTLSDPDRFFSYRRACLAGERDYGRGLAAIVLAP